MSLRFALGVFLLIALACVIGTLVPQGSVENAGSDVAKFVEKNPGTGSLMRILEAVGVTGVYSSKWFAVLLFLLAASLVACSVRRIPGIRNRTGRGRWRAVGSFLTHISFLLVLLGAVARVMLGEHGNMGLSVGETKDFFDLRGEQRKLPFAVHLEKFEIEMHEVEDKDGTTGARIVEEHLDVHSQDGTISAHLPVEIGAEHTLIPAGGKPDSENTVRVTITGRVLDFVIDRGADSVTSRSDEPNNPAINVQVVRGGVTNSQWLFAKFPDFAKMHGNGSDEADDELHMRYQTSIRSGVPKEVKNYNSSLRIVKDGQVVLEKTIKVNLPLKYGGYSFYQSRAAENWTGLQVVRDPGVPLVYSGFALMIIGLSLIFYLQPSLAKTTASDETQKESC